MDCSREGEGEEEASAVGGTWTGRSFVLFVVLYAAVVLAAAAAAAAAVVVVVVAAVAARTLDVGVAAVVEAAAFANSVAAGAPLALAFAAALSRLTLVLWLPSSTSSRASPSQVAAGKSYSSSYPCRYDPYSCQRGLDSKDNRARCRASSGIPELALQYRRSDVRNRTDSKGMVEVPVAVEVEVLPSIEGTVEVGRRESW